MKKAFLLIMCVCVAMVAVTTGCTSKKVDGDDSINTDSTEADRLCHGGNSCYSYA